MENITVTCNRQGNPLVNPLTRCSTLIFLLTCPLGNYVSSFTCRVYFFGCPKKSPARFASLFIEFSILVPSNFMPSINPTRDVIWYHCLLAVKSLHKISTLYHCNQHSHAWMTFTIHGLLSGKAGTRWRLHRVPAFGATPLVPFPFAFASSTHPW